MNTSFLMMTENTPAAITTHQYLDDDHCPDYYFNSNRSKSCRSDHSEKSNFSISIYVRPRWRRSHSRKTHHDNQYNNSNNNNDHKCNNRMLLANNQHQQYPKNHSVSDDLPTTVNTIPVWIQVVDVAPDTTDDDLSVITDASSIDGDEEEEYDNDDVLMEDVTTTTESTTSASVMYESSSTPECQNPAPVCCILVMDDEHNDDDQDNTDWIHTGLDAVPLLCFRVSFDGGNNHSIQDNNFDHVELQGDELLDYASALWKNDQTWMFVVTFQSSGITTCLQAIDLVTTLRWIMVGSTSRTTRAAPMTTRGPPLVDTTTTRPTDMNHAHDCRRPWQRGWNFGDGADDVAFAVDDVYQRV